MKVEIRAVYAHYEGKDVAYVGRGNVSRMLDWSGRSEEHSKWMLNKIWSDQKLTWAKVLYLFSDYEDSKVMESLLIKKFLPKFNKMGVIPCKTKPRSQKSRKEHAIGVTGKNNPNYKHGKSTKQAKALRPGFSIQTCPSCGLIGKGPNMTRYHFKNCKNQEIK